ncbi:MFS transporter [Pelagibius marinus]|uniref:MFS transporter n=1 Tax=Pelagibius marinus TaxID=2762760 RepID=UPI001872FE2B|nr:MFS transporter [Pelagibius marinus]
MPAPVLVALTYLVGLGIVYPFLPFQALALGASPLTVSLLLVTDTAVVLLLAPVWGRLSDRLGRRRVIFFALATAPFANLLLAHADSLSLLFLARACAGVGNAVIPVIQALVADRTCLRTRVCGMANVNSAYGLAFIIGPLVGTVLLGAGGDDYRSAAFGAAGFAVLSLLLTLALGREDSGKDAPAATAPATIAPPPRRIVMAPLCLAPIALMAVLSFVYASMDSTLGLWSQRVLAWDARDVSLAFTLAGAAAVFSLWVLIPRLCGRYGEGRVTAGACAAMGLGFLLFVLWPSDLAVALALMLLGAGIAMCLSCLQALLSKAAPDNVQGSAMGLNHAVLSFARILGPVWGGFALGSLGVGWPYLAGALLTFAALLVVIWFYRPEARVLQN